MDIKLWKTDATEFRVQRSFLERKRHLVKHPTPGFKVYKRTDHTGKRAKGIYLGVPKDVPPYVVSRKADSKWSSTDYIDQVGDRTRRYDYFRMFINDKRLLEKYQRFIDERETRRSITLTRYANSAMPVRAGLYLNPDGRIGATNDKLHFLGLALNASVYFPLEESSADTVFSRIRHYTTPMRERFNILQGLTFRPLISGELQPSLAEHGYKDYGVAESLECGTFDVKTFISLNEKPYDMAERIWL